MMRLVIRPSKVGIHLISFPFAPFNLPCLKMRRNAVLTLVLHFVCVTFVLFARVPRIRTFY